MTRLNVSVPNAANGRHIVWVPIALLAVRDDDDNPGEGNEDHIYIWDRARRAGRCLAA